MEKFKCVRCGACCRWKGAVKVTSAEVDAIAEYLNMPLDEFLAEHTVITPDRQHLSLCEKPNGECEYLVTGADGLPGCAIEKVKPQQCRDFPGRWNFPGWREVCGGGKQ